MTASDLLKKINADGRLLMSQGKNEYNSIFDWQQIKPSFGFFCDFLDNDKTIKPLLAKSKLSDHNSVLVDAASDMPILRVNVDYYIDNWLDFTDANNGMGSFVITEDYRLLIEYTDDAKYFMFSNFEIMNSKQNGRS